MESEHQDNLQKLRESVLRELVGLSDYLASDEDVSYELLLTLARNTGSQDLLQKAFSKIQAIEDPKQKGDALLDMLDEVELLLADSNDDGREQLEEPPEETLPPGEVTE